MLNIKIPENKKYSNKVLKCSKNNPKLEIIGKILIMISLNYYHSSQEMAEVINILANKDNLN